MSQCFLRSLDSSPRNVHILCNYEEGKVVRTILVILVDNVLHVVIISLEQFFAFSHPFDLVRQPEMFPTTS
jgi:hypothetical protein